MIALDGHVLFKNFVRSNFWDGTDAFNLMCGTGSAERYFFAPDSLLEHEVRFKILKDWMIS